MGNRVDYIKSSIEEMEQTIVELQATCEHKFSMTKSHGELKESLVSNVYLGNSEVLRNQDNLLFTISCFKCSFTKYCSVAYTCPKCFIGLDSGDDSSIELREKYWGSSYIYYRSRIHSCSNNDFAIVNDVWDQ